MKSNLLLTLFCLLLSSQVWGQTQPQPKPGTKPDPKKPVPYVYRKEYEEKIAELSGKVNSALNNSSAIRRDLGNKLGMVDTLSEKMAQVEEILNSANFKISTTSDSLKRTKFSVDEFRKETEARQSSLEHYAHKLNRYIWILLVVTLLLIGLVAAIVNMRFRKMRSAMQQQAEMWRVRITEEMDKQREDANATRKRLEADISLLKLELLDKINEESQATAGHLKKIMEKLDEQKNS